MPGFFKSQKGAAPVLILVAVIGLISFLAVSATFNFQDKLFSTLFPKPKSFAATGTINVNPNIRYQTIIGWETMDKVWMTMNTGNATYQGSPKFPQFRDHLYDQAVNDLGINRLR